ncbi:MAG: radical SAM family heme chaperone HemW [Cyclobacteriaceae bacterium]
MAGIYLHIPFCKQACHYCDFHFSTNLSAKTEVITAIANELELRKDELHGEQIHSIYFGGGTPSLLDEGELSLLLNQINRHYRLGDQVEVTLEANPDDLTKQKLRELKAGGVNRLSVGIQTFDDARLKYINRAHNSEEAIDCLNYIQAAGFHNYSADLIYALPPDEMDYWISDLHLLISYNPTHISIYGLTIEDKTVFGNWEKKGRIKQISEETAAKQYQMAVDYLVKHGYDHYEVSNFAKPGFESRHNAGYWDDQKYLGVGPGAHSYDGSKRSFNIANNAKYLTNLNQNQLVTTIEELSLTNQMNEYIFTHLRTKKGALASEFRLKFGRDLLVDKQKELREFGSQKLLRVEKDRIALSSEGLMIADEITWRLFYED